LIPRTLSEDEKRVLRHLIVSELDEPEVLLRQIPFAHVTRHWIEGLPSIDIEVEPGVERATTTTRTLSTEGNVSNENGDPIGLIVVWLEQGALAGLEYAWFTDEPPTEWPSDDQISVKMAKYES